MEGEAEMSHRVKNGGDTYSPDQAGGGSGGSCIVGARICETYHLVAQVHYLMLRLVRVMVRGGGGACTSHSSSSQRTLSRGVVPCMLNLRPR